MSLFAQAAGTRKAPGPPNLADDTAPGSATASDGSVRQLLDYGGYGGALSHIGSHAMSAPSVRPGPASCWRHLLSAMLMCAVTSGAPGKPVAACGRKPLT
jgi:hypothetical protein